MKSSKGLTLIEIVFALFIFVVAVLGAVALQRTTLQSTYEARAVKRATAILENKVEQIRALPSQVNNLCQTGEDSAGFTLDCTPTPCTLQSDGTVQCSSSVSKPDLYRIELTITGPGLRQSITATTYVRAGD